MSEDSPFVNTFGIEDNSLPKINLESWIKKDEMRFDEPSAKSEEVPFGSMDLGVDPDEEVEAEPGESVLPDAENTKLPQDDFRFPGKTTVLRFVDPEEEEKQPEYVDPRLPKDKTKKLRIEKRPEEDL